MPILAKTQTRQGLVRLSEEDIQYLENHQLVIDPGMEWYDADARRPYYRLRGRRIPAPLLLSLCANACSFGVGWILLGGI